LEDALGTALRVLVSSKLRRWVDKDVRIVILKDGILESKDLEKGMRVIPDMHRLPRSEVVFTVA
jgi:hypothetical protein